jgi:hypothetical protein
LALFNRGVYLSSYTMLVAASWVMGLKQWSTCNENNKEKQTKVIQKKNG